MPSSIEELLVPVVDLMGIIRRFPSLVHRPFSAIYVVNVDP
jgi:hypothetical protein